MRDKQPGTGTTDSPLGWVNEHIQRYVETGGEDGYWWKPGVPTLLLTTTGRRSGQRRRTALIFQPDGDDLVVVASDGGDPRHPAWYHNVQADPRVEVQVRDRVRQGTARTATAEERPRLWALMNQVWPSYATYQTLTDREIPVVVITPEA